jgi:hypothetical protein
LIRHLHDLAAFEGHLTEAKKFAALVQQVAAEDTGRGGEGSPSEPTERFAAMLDLLQSDKAWASDYEAFVWQVSFAKAGETISFAETFTAAKRLAELVYRKKAT